MRKLFLLMLCTGPLTGPLLWLACHNATQGRRGLAGALLVLVLGLQIATPALAGAALVYLHRLGVY